MNDAAILADLIAREQSVLDDATAERNALAVDFPCCDSLGWMMLVGSECVISNDRRDRSRRRVAQYTRELALAA